MSKKIERFAWTPPKLQLPFRRREFLVTFYGWISQAAKIREARREIFAARVIIFDLLIFAARASTQTLATMASFLRALTASSPPTGRYERNEPM